MKPASFRIVLAFCLFGLAGCASSDHAPPGGPPPAVIRHRQALLLFDKGEYARCIDALGEWLERHEADRPGLGASARFYTALSYRKLGKKENARAWFLDICRRYAAVPAGRPAARWRAWAQQEVDSLGE